MIETRTADISVLRYTPMPLALPLYRRYLKGTPRDTMDRTSASRQCPPGRAYMQAGINAPHSPRCDRNKVGAQPHAVLRPEACASGQREESSASLRRYSGAGQKHRSAAHHAETAGS